MTEATTTEVKPVVLPTGEKLAAAITKLRTARDAAVASIAGIDTQLVILVAAQAAEAELITARAAIEVDGLPGDTEVSFIYGRKDTRRERTGKVFAFAKAAGELPARYKIIVGNDFDSEVLTVPARDVNVVAQPEAVAE